MSIEIDAALAASARQQAAHLRWQESGEPAAGDWLVTVDHRGQRVEPG